MAGIHPPKCLDAEDGALPGFWGTYGSVFGVLGHYLRSTIICVLVMEVFRLVSYDLWSCLSLQFNFVWVEC